MILSHLIANLVFSLCTGATSTIFDTFVKMRTGLGTGNGSSEQVFMVCEGALYQSPSGKMLARFEGFDATRGIRIGEDHVRQLTRKMFWFRDVNTGDILTEFEGQPVQNIKYDYQVFDFRRGVDSLTGKESILPTIVEGPRGVPCSPGSFRFAGPHQLMIHLPVFIDVDIPGRGKYQAWETYDFSLDPSFPKDRPPHLSWSRQGPSPPFGSTVIMHCTGKRVCSFEELPKSMRQFVEEGGHDLFRAAPLNMAEVERLQKAASHASS
jgi:hypothetical protein